MRLQPSSPRGFTRPGLARVELVAVLLSIVAATAVVLPVLGRSRDIAGADESLGNLIALGVAHAVYSADWNDRQLTVIDDEIASYGAAAPQAFVQFENVNGEPHPPLVLGWGLLNGELPPFLFRYVQTLGFSGNHVLLEPLRFSGYQAGFGFFRIWNTRPFHDYVGGRFYDPVFYPAIDPAPFAIVEEAFDDPWEYVDVPVESSLGDIPAWSSYCLSPAALFDPAVMRRDDPADPMANGWVDPYSYDDGFRSPSRSQILYPSLKTHMLEHHWLRNAPGAPACNPAFEPGTYAGCEPYYFNHGFLSRPGTLFYDLSVRELPNSEVLAADERLMSMVGYGLWSRDTPFGPDGYFSEYGYDPISVSHHVLTTDGAEGRDTVEGAAGDVPSPYEYETGSRR